MKKKHSTPSIAVEADQNSRAEADSRNLVAYQKVIRERKVFLQNGISQIEIILKYLMENVIIVGRRAKWREIVGQIRSL